VQGEVVGEAGQQMLAVRDVSQHGAPGQVGRRMGGHPEFAHGQHTVTQCVVETASQRVHGVTLGHLSIVLLRPPTPVVCNGSAFRQH